MRVIIEGEHRGAHPPTPDATPLMDVCTGETVWLRSYGIFRTREGIETAEGVAEADGYDTRLVDITTLDDADGPYHPVTQTVEVEG